MNILKERGIILSGDKVGYFVRDKLRYWDAITDQTIETGNENKMQIISECDDLGYQSTTIFDPDQLILMVIPYFKIIFTAVLKMFLLFGGELIINQS